MNSVSRYALIALDPNQPDPPRALAVGPLADATKLIPSSLALLQARADVDESLSFLQDSARKLQRLAHGLADAKAEYAYQVISRLCDGIAKMTTRLDAYAQREAERQRQARADARKAIEDSLPDPDTPADAVGAYPAPNLEPDLRTQDPEDEGAYRHYPDGPKTKMPGEPSELPEDAPRDDQGHLPPELLPGAPPLVGTMPVWDIRELKHPQPEPPIQAAIGGP
jgi:hypothetical protein